MLALTLAAVLSPGAPIPPPKSRPVYDYSALSVEQAHALAGKLIRVRANVTDADPEYAGAGETDDTTRLVGWRKGKASLDEGPVLVEGRLRVRLIGPYTIHGAWVEPFWQLRLEQARPIGHRDD